MDPRPPLASDNPPPQSPETGFAATPDMLDINLASPQGAALLVATATAHGPLLLPAAHRLSRLFLMRSPWAPALRFVGGQAIFEGGPGALCDRRTFSQSGPAETLEGAMASCIGEAIELLSQIERPGDVVQVAALDDVAERILPGIDQPLRAQLLATPLGMATPLAWMRGRQAHAGHDILVPADWAVRRAPARMTVHPPWHVGSGVAAGPDWEWAALRAVLELIERDAAALWWIGGRRGCPIAIDDPALAEANRLSSHLRQGQTARVSWVLDITTDLGVPCMVAVSTDRDGRGLVCGFGARPTRTAAIRGAILENAQMELALMLARGRTAQAATRSSTAPLEPSPASVSSLDIGHVTRATGIDAASCDLLHPHGMPRGPRTADEAEPTTNGQALSRLTATLAAHGLQAAFLDHTRPDFGLPVVRAIVPGLQPLPSTIVTQRLRTISIETGGGYRFTRGLALF